MFNAFGGILNDEELEKERDWWGKVVQSALLTADFMPLTGGTHVSFAELLCPTDVASTAKDLADKGVMAVSGMVDDATGTDISGTIAGVKSLKELTADVFNVIDGTSKGVWTCHNFDEFYANIVSDLMDKEKGKGGHFSYVDAIRACASRMPYKLSPDNTNGIKGRNISFRAACRSFMYNLVDLSQLYAESVSQLDRKRTCRMLVDNNYEIRKPALCSGKCTIFTKAKVRLSNPDDQISFETEVEDFCDGEIGATVEQELRNVTGAIDLAVDWVIDKAKIFGNIVIEQYNRFVGKSIDAEQKSHLEKKKTYTRRTNYVFLVTDDSVEDVTDLSDDAIMEKYNQAVENKKAKKAKK